MKICGVIWKLYTSIEAPETCVFSFRNTVYAASESSESDSRSVYCCCTAWLVQVWSLHISVHVRPFTKQCSSSNPTLSQILRIQRMSKRYSKMRRYKSFWRFYWCTKLPYDHKFAFRLHYNMVATSPFISINVFNFMSFNLIPAYNVIVCILANKRSAVRPLGHNRHGPKIGEVAVLLFECGELGPYVTCLLYTSPSPRDRQKSRMPSSA